MWFTLSKSNIKIFITSLYLSLLRSPVIGESFCFSRKSMHEKVTFSLLFMSMIPVGCVVFQACVVVFMSVGCFVDDFRAWVVGSRVGPPFPVQETSFVSLFTPPLEIPVSSSLESLFCLCITGNLFWSRIATTVRSALN